MAQWGALLWLWEPGCVLGCRGQCCFGSVAMGRGVAACSFFGTVVSFQSDSSDPGRVLVRGCACPCCMVAGGVEGVTLLPPPSFPWEGVSECFLGCATTSSLPWPGLHSWLFTQCPCPVGILLKCLCWALEWSECHRCELCRTGGCSGGHHLPKPSAGRNGGSP